MKRPGAVSSELGGARVPKRRPRAAPWGICASVVAAVLAGCAASHVEPREHPLQAEQMVYESQVEIKAAKVSVAKGREQVSIWEWDHKGVLRLVRLDLANGKGSVAWEVPSGSPTDPLGFYLDLAQDGSRLVMVTRPSWDESQLVVRDDTGNWAPVTPLDDRERFLLGWSPDAEALAYLVMSTEHGTRVAAVSVAHPPRLAKEIILTPEGSRSSEFAWSADGQQIYHVVYRPGSAERYLDAVKWPSLETQRLLSGAWLGRLSAARRTGDVVVFVERVDTDGMDTGDVEPILAVWRVSPSGNVEKTPVTVNRVPFAAVVSPDGKRLAVAPSVERERANLVPYGSGVIVYSLADGTSRVFRGFEGKPVTSLNWVLGGQAVLFVEGGKRVWVVAANNRIPDVGPVTVEKLVPGHPVVDAEDESRRNLQQLGMALLMYLADHEDRYPNLADIVAIRQALDEYVEEDDVFVDPRTKQPYGMNLAPSGKRLVDIEDPVEMVVFYETVAREDGSRDVAFADGHVACVSADRWDEIEGALATR